MAGRGNHGRFRRVLGLLRRALLLDAPARLLRAVFLRRLVGHDGPSLQHQGASSGPTAQGENGQPRTSSTTWSESGQTATALSLARICGSYRRRGQVSGGTLG